MNATKVLHIVERFKHDGDFTFAEASLQLIAEGCSPEEVERLLGKLTETEYYIETQTGDALQINWEDNRPPVSNKSVGWTRVSKMCYDIHIGRK